jgi:hypothetical protein
LQFSFVEFVCGNLILLKDCKLVLFLSFFYFAQLIVPTTIKLPGKARQTRRAIFVGLMYCTLGLNVRR